MNKFSIKNTASQKGKVAIVTGANDGVGFETSFGLVSKGASLIMACRNLQKAESAKAKILKQFPDADVSIILLDLNSLESVKEFADNFKENHSTLDILVNNAGIMVPPLNKTKEDFESQMGVNYFAHFLLTGLLMKELNAAENGRVVSLSSIAHKRGKIDFNNLNAEQKYNKSQAYSQSKLACLMFAYELDRNLRKSGSKVMSVAAHPGVSPTNLFKNLPFIARKLFGPVMGPLLNTPKQAALPSLMAALDSSVQSGDYCGPSGFMEMSGNPAKASSQPQSHNKDVAKKLWDVSEELVGFKFNL